MCWQCHENGWHSPSQFSNTNVCRPDRTANTGAPARENNQSAQWATQREAETRTAVAQERQGASNGDPVSLTAVYTAVPNWSAGTSLRPAGTSLCTYLHTQNIHKWPVHFQSLD